MPPRSRGPALALVWRSLSKDSRPRSRRTELCSYPHNASQNLLHRSHTTSRPVSSLTHHRTFTAIAAQQKSHKPKKASKGSSDPNPPVPDNKAQAGRDADVDPYDFSELEAGIAKALARLKDALGKTRNAGRVSVEMVEGLGVEVKGGGGAHKVRLADMATVVPKGGRMVQVYAQEAAHTKPLTASILSSPYSLTPAADPHNPLLLNIPIPPATAETRAQAAAEAKRSLERALHDVRMARGDAQKRFRKMELGKLAREDELRRAHKAMEEVVKKGEGEGKTLCDGAIKSLER